MTNVRQRIIWLNDEEWTALGNMAVRAGLTRSRLVAASIEGEPGPPRTILPEAPRPIASDVPRTITPYVPRVTPDPTFRPAPKPGKR